MNYMHVRSSSTHRPIDIATSTQRGSCTFVYICVTHCFFCCLFVPICLHANVDLSVSAHVCLVYILCKMCAIDRQGRVCANHRSFRLFFSHLRGKSRRQCEKNLSGFRIIPEPRILRFSHAEFLSRHRGCNSQCPCVAFTKHIRRAPRVPGGSVPDTHVCARGSDMSAVEQDCRFCAGSGFTNRTHMRTHRITDRFHFTWSIEHRVSGGFISTCFHSTASSLLHKHHIIAVRM